MLFFSGRFAPFLIFWGASRPTCFFSERFAPVQSNHINYQRKRVPRFGKRFPRFTKWVPWFGKWVPRFGKRFPRFGKRVPRFENRVPWFGKWVPRFGKRFPRFGKWVLRFGKWIVNSKIMFPEQKRTLKHYKSLMNVCWNSQKFPAGYRRPKKNMEPKTMELFQKAKKPWNFVPWFHGSMGSNDTMIYWMIKRGSIWFDRAMNWNARSFVILFGVAT